MTGGLKVINTFWLLQQPHTAPGVSMALTFFDSQCFKYLRALNDEHIIET